MFGLGRKSSSPKAPPKVLQGVPLDQLKPPELLQRANLLLQKLRSSQGEPSKAKPGAPDFNLIRINELQRVVLQLSAFVESGKHIKPSEQAVWRAQVQQLQEDMQEAIDLVIPPKPGKATPPPAPPPGGTAAGGDIFAGMSVNIEPQPMASSGPAPGSMEKVSTGDLGDMFAGMQVGASVGSLGISSVANVSSPPVVSLAAASVDSGSETSSGVPMPLDEGMFSTGSSSSLEGLVNASDGNGMSSLAKTVQDGPIATTSEASSTASKSAAKSVGGTTQPKRKKVSRMRVGYAREQAPESQPAAATSGTIGQTLAETAPSKPTRHPVPKAYQEWFDLARESEVGVSGAAAVSFFLKSGLEKRTLADVWDLARSRKGQQVLDLEDFARAMKLIALAQNGMELSLAALERCEATGTLPLAKLSIESGLGDVSGTVAQGADEPDASHSVPATGEGDLLEGLTIMQPTASGSEGDMASIPSTTDRPGHALDLAGMQMHDHASATLADRIQPAESIGALGTGDSSHAQNDVHTPTVASSAVVEPADVRGPVRVSDDPLRRKLKEAEMELESAGPFDQIFEAHKKVLAAKLALAQAESQSLVSQEASVQEKRKEAVDLSLSAFRLKQELQEKQNEAVEQEDFELADELNGKIEAADAALLRAQEGQSDIEAACEEAARLLGSCLEKERQLQIDAALALRNLLEQQQELATAEAAEFESLNQVHQQEMDALATELNQKEETLGEELAGLEEQQKDLDEKISAATCTLTEERDATKAKHDSMVVDLEELMAQVKAKEAEIADVAATLTQQDQAIADAAAKFDRQMNIFRETRAGAEQEQAELMQRREDARQRELAQEELVKSHQERMRRLSENQEVCAAEAERLEAAAATAQKVQEAAAAIRIKKAGLSAEEKRSGDQLVALRAQIADRRAAESETRAALEKVQAAIQNAKSVISEADARLPELEAEKKTAAAAKNFKEAARLAAESKALSSSREGSESSLGALEVQEREVRAALEEKSLGVVGLEKQAFAIARMGSVARCKWLLLASAEKRELVDAAAAAEDYEGAEHIQNEVDLYQGELNKLVSEYEILPSELADEARNEEAAAGQAQDLSADSSEATAAAVDTDTGIPEAAADSGIGTEGAA